MYRHHCTLGYAIHLLRVQPHHTTTPCTSAPLAMDIPSLVLGIGVTVSLCLHAIFVRQVRSFRRDIELSRVLEFADSRVPGPTVPPSSLWNELRPSRALRVAIFLGVAVMASAFYWLTLTDQYLMSSLARVQGLDRHCPVHHPACAVSTLRSGWWASYTTHPAGAAAWLLLGCLGAYLIIGDQVTFRRLTRRISSLRVADEPEGYFWGMPDPGMWPLTQFVDIKVFGLATFLMSFTAIGYLIRDPRGAGPWNLVLVLVFLVVMWSTSRQVIPIIRQDGGSRASVCTRILGDAMLAVSAGQQNRDERPLCDRLYALARITEARRYEALKTRTMSQRAVQGAALVVTLISAYLTVIPLLRGK